MENYNVVEREGKKKPNSSFTSVPIKSWETHRDTIMLDRAEQMLQWVAGKTNLSGAGRFLPSSSSVVNEALW